MLKKIAVLLAGSLLWFGLPASGDASSSCPVLYPYPGHQCYAGPTALDVTQAERQVPVRDVNPLATVRSLTTLPLTAVIVDRTSRSVSRVPRVWIIDYVFGHAPNLGKPEVIVTRWARFLIIGEAVGRITLRSHGIELYDQPQFLRIRVNSRGHAIWHVSVNLPNRNGKLVIHSTLPRLTLERLMHELMRRST
jgi:hypothetical protein